MLNGRELKRKIGVGMLVLVFSTSLIAENIVENCEGGKCFSTIVKASASNTSSTKVKKFKSSTINVADEPVQNAIFVSLDNNEGVDSEDFVVTSLRKIDEEKKSGLFKKSKKIIYACDDNYELVCNKSSNKDKEICECIS